MLSGDTGASFKQSCRLHLDCAFEQVSHKSGVTKFLTLLCDFHIEDLQQIGFCIDVDPIVVGMRRASR